MYKKGEGVKKDTVQVVHWFRKAAVQGGVDAQNNLAIMYKNGEGVEKESRGLQQHSMASALCN
jgi:TPR repeat protein